MTAYSNQFDEALRRWSSGDHRGALAGFSAVTEADPSVADAWLGRIASGDVALPTLRKAHENSQFLYRETRRQSWNDGQLAGQLTCPKYVVLPINSPDTLALGYAAALITAGEYARADQLLSRRDLAAGDNTAWRHFLHTCLFYVTQRWPDVLRCASNAPAQPGRSPTAVELRSATTTMAALAAARLDRHQHALDLLATLPEQVGNPYIRADGALIRGWVHRALGETAQARKFFDQAVVDGALLADAQAALSNENLRLPVVTAGQIAARTDPWDVATQPTPAAAQADHRAELLAEADTELDKQIGLVEVKHQVKKLRAEIKVNAARVERGLSAVVRSHHLVFSGPPGTGKTTIARVVANIYCGLGVLQTANVIEAKRVDFVGETLGSTAPKTNQLIDSALDGVLFIDEAYTLIQTGLKGGDAFGREAVDTLLARMENDRDRLMVIIAGYEDEIDRFLGSNEGLSSRFPRRIRFPSYTSDELVDIAAGMAAQKQSTIAAAALAVLRSVCATLAQREVWVDEEGKVCGVVGTLTDLPVGARRRRVLDVAGNGRFIRNVVEDAFGEQMYRIADLLDTTEVDDETMTTVTAADLSTAVTTIVGSIAPGIVDHTPESPSVRPEGTGGLSRRGNRAR